MVALRSVFFPLVVSVSTSLFTGCEGSRTAGIQATSKGGIKTLGRSASDAGLKTGYISSANGQTQVRYRVSGDKAIIDDDVIMPLSKITEKPNDEKGKLYLFQSGNLWPNGRVPYVVDPGFCCSVELQNAFNAWAAAGVTFVPKTPADVNYVAFVPETFDGACGSSSLGMVGGRQEVAVRPANGFCNPGRTTIHEIGHALGFLHEHNRPDRDSYIFIPPSEANERQNAIRPGQPLGTYDLNSIMHYGSDQVPGMVERATNMPIQRKMVLSSNDIQRAKDVYGGAVASGGSSGSSSGASGVGGQPAPAPASTGTLSSVAPFNACLNTIGVNDPAPLLIRDSGGVPGFACYDFANSAGKPIIVCSNAFSSTSCRYTGLWYSKGMIVDPTSLPPAPKPAPTPAPVSQAPSTPRSFVAPLNACVAVFGIYDSFPVIALDPSGDPVFVCKFGAFAPYPVMACFSSSDPSSCYNTGLVSNF